jgi:predicted TIM-barrel fold metal-dependent hydrolase
VNLPSKQRKGYEHKQPIKLPHVAMMWTMEPEEKCGQRLCDQTAYRAKQRAPLFEQGVHEDLGNMDIICHHCGALHWIFKKLANSTLANPLFGTCCHKGKIILSLLQQQPHMLQQMFDENDVMAKEFRDHIR